MEANRPSRSKMLQGKAKQKAMQEGDIIIQAAYAHKHPSLLTVPVKNVSEQFLKQFCEEHNLTYTVKGTYYQIT